MGVIIKREFNGVDAVRRKWEPQLMKKWGTKKKNLDRHS